MFLGSEHFNNIFSDIKPVNKPQSQYTEERPLYTQGTGITVVNGQTLYTAGTQPNNPHQLYSY